jgi:hypothetical protein
MNLQDLSQETGPATAARPVTVPLKRFVGGCLLAFLMGVTTGCYSYTSIPAAAPAPGTDIVVGLNDQGRLSLGQSVGPAAQQIEGTVQSQSDSAYVLSVSSVSYFNGGINKWSGEPLTINRTLINDVKERRFSQSKTALVVIGGLAAVLAVIFHNSLFATGGPEKQGNPPPPDPQ